MSVAVDRPKAQGYGVQLGDDWFRVATSAEHVLNVTTRDSLAPRQDTGENPDENILDLGQAFSRGNLSGGEGLDQFPRPAGEPRSERDVTRFWDSANLSFSRPADGLNNTTRLSPRFITVGAHSPAAVDAGASSDNWYTIATDTVRRFSGLNDTTAEESDDLGTLTLIQIAVGFDDRVAVLDTNGDVWYKAPLASSYLKIYDSTVHGPAIDAKAIWIAKDRVFAYCDDPATAAQGLLLEIGIVLTGSVASPTLGPCTYTTVDTFAGVMLDLVDAGHAIVASVSDGSVRSYVPETDNAGDAPLLTIKSQMPLPVGEVAFALAWNLGQLLIFTIDDDGDDQRLYTAQVLDVRFDYAVGQLQLIRTWNGVSQSTPDYTFAVANTRDEMFFWVEESAGVNNLWRYDLATGGLSRHIAPAYASATALFAFDDKLGSIAEPGIVATSETLLSATGYVILPIINFNLNTTINWLAWVMEFIGVNAGAASIELYRSSNPLAILDPEHPDWIIVEEAVDASQSGAERTLIDVSSNTMALMVKLYANSAGTLGPELVRVAVRGLPKHRDWIVDVPVNISDLVEVPGRMPSFVSRLGNRNYELLLSKLGTSTSCLVLEPPTHIWGVVDAVSIPINYTAPRGSVGRLAMVRVRGNRILSDSGANPIGNQGMGVGVMGLVEMGG